MSHTFTIYIFNKLEETFPSGFLSRPGWFLANIPLLFLAGDIVPETVRSDPGAVLVAVPVIRLTWPEVTEGEGGAISPGKLSLVQEVSETNPGPG